MRRFNGWLPCEAILLGQFEQELAAIRMAGFSIAGYLASLAVGEVCVAQSGMVDGYIPAYHL